MRIAKSAALFYLDCTIGSACCKFSKYTNEASKIFFITITDDKIVQKSNHSNNVLDTEITCFITQKYRFFCPKQEQTYRKLYFDRTIQTSREACIIRACDIPVNLTTLRLL